MDHVWGYTIINDMTARERQRDHKQFYIGKSPDTFCPIRPVAVPKEELPEVLSITTSVNGEKRQSATTNALIFSVACLVKTMSEGQALQLGDVHAAGTPAGVGFGLRPMVFLKPGDEIRVSVSGLGSLVNRIAPFEQPNKTLEILGSQSHITVNNDKTVGGVGLTHLQDKRLYYRQSPNETTASPVVFIHRLGGSSDYLTPLATKLQGTRTLHFTNLEGHGLSPTSALSQLSIPSFANDVAGLCKRAGADRGITLVAHSMDCHVAVQVALTHPGLSTSLVLMGPPPSPLPEAGAKATLARAALVREKGMLGVVDAIVSAGTSQHTQGKNSVAVTATLLSLLSQDPEDYAKSCTALASVKTIDYSNLKCRTLILTGTEDKVSPPSLCAKYRDEIDNCHLQVLDDIGHRHLFEDAPQITESVASFLE